VILSILTTIVLLGAASGNGATYIRAGHVFDGERFIGSRVIVVEDGRIAAVEDSGFVAPAGAEVIDASDAAVMPGLIDGHCHFMETPRPYADNLERYGRGKLEAEAMSASASSRLHLLLNGITTIADMGGSLAAYQGLRAALDKGRIIGPELYFSGPQITAPSGHPAGTTYTGEHDLVDLATFQVADTDVVRREVATLANAGVEFVAIVYDRTPYKGRSAPGLRLDVAQAAMAEAHKRGLKAFAQVGSEAEVLDMVRAGADGIEHSFKATSDSILTEMAERGVSFTPTIEACVRSVPAEAPGVEQTLRRAWELGVPLVVGTDFPDSCEGNCGDAFFREMERFKGAGMGQLDVLRAATFQAARKLGKADSLGRVAPGYRANLVFIRGSADSGALSAGRIERVMLHGRTVVQDGRVCADCESGFRENSLSYLGYPYWDPLLSWMAGGTATDYDFLRTGVTAEADFMYSIRNMWFANTVFDLPSPIPRTALRTGVHFDNQNRLFYDLGNDTHLDDTTQYSNFIFREWASGRTRISGPWMMLGYVVFDQTRVGTYGGKALSDTLAGNQGGNEVAVSLNLAHDTRDHQFNPWYGHYIGVGAQVAPALLPNGHSFEKVVFDARGYASLAHRHVLAGRVLCQQAFGDVPFYYLPEFGGDTLGRGYVPFRFRDRVSVIGQLEYRFPVWSWLSGVAFADVGQFQPAVSKLRLDRFHPSIGFGPRFNFGSNESSIVGIDIGFTPEGWNLVLHNGQVF
jgi:imidazolonepropionase-like amidohydrolase